MTNNTPSKRRPFGTERVAAADLRTGDTIHQWSLTGGTWKVTHADLDLMPYITLRSDMGATRRMTAEQIDAKGAWLSSKAGE